MKPLTFAVAAITGLSSFAVTTPSYAAPAKAGLICPVTGTKIRSAKFAVGHTAYKGKTYYFCCSSCKPRFDKSPAKYIKNVAHGKYEKM